MYSSAKLQSPPFFELVFLCDKVIWLTVVDMSISPFHLQVVDLGVAGKVRVGLTAPHPPWVIKTNWLPVILYLASNQQQQKQTANKITAANDN